MRRFQLINEYGTVYPLINDPQKAFLWQPSGLGFSYSTQYRESDGFFLEMSKEIEQTSKTGVLVFFKDPYEEYRRFIDFITQSKKLRLAYAPEQDWYYMDVDVEYVEKSELELDGTLQCSVSMLPTSPIYSINYVKYEVNGTLPSSMKEYKLEAGEDGGEEEDFWYAYKLDPDASTPTEVDYWYTYSDTAVGGRIEITANSQLPSGIEIFTQHPVSAPVVTFYDGNDVIGRVDLSAVSVGVDEKLLYSGLPTSAGVTLTSGGTDTDITNLLGISPTAPAFFMLPPNKKITAELSADSLLGVDIDIRVYQYYASV